MVVAQPVEMSSRLPPQVQEMLEPGGRDERRLRTLALQKRVGRDRRPVREALHVACADGSSGREHRLLLSARSRNLRRRDAAILDEDGVRERAADIDAENAHAAKADSYERTVTHEIPAGAGASRLRATEERTEAPAADRRRPEREPRNTVGTGQKVHAPREDPAVERKEALDVDAHVARGSGCHVDIDARCLARREGDLSATADECLRVRDRANEERDVVRASAARLRPHDGEVLAGLKTASKVRPS